MLLGQSRVFFSMSKDGLLPPVFHKVHPKFRTPAKSSTLFMIFVSLFAAFVPARVVGEMTSIGTLFAFILVCIGVWILRVKQPDVPRAFKTPWVPLVPILGIFTCLFMMVFLPLDTWIRLLVWMVIGFDVYIYYGMKHSLLSEHKLADDVKANKIVSITGLCLVTVLIMVALIHHSNDNSDTGLFYFTLIFSFLHILLYLQRLFKTRSLQ
jgi:basic amino acid/polyamine antiporter, APA family